MARSRVVLIEVPDCSAEALKAAVTRGFEFLPELAGFTGSGQVLLKADLERKDARENPTSTDPALVSCILSKCAQRGAERCQVGDAPTEASWKLWRRARSLILDKMKNRFYGRAYQEFSSMYQAIMNCRLFQDLFSMRFEGFAGQLLTVDELGLETKVDMFARCGIRDAALQAGAPLCYMEVEHCTKTTSRTARFITQPWICDAALRSPGMILLPCVNSAQARIPALRTLFNVVPTAIREVYTKTSDMSDMRQELYIDILAALPATPAVVGDARSEHGLVTMSADPVAHDVVAMTLAGLDPGQERALRAAHDAGVGVGDIGKIDIVRSAA